MNMPIEPKPPHRGDTKRGAGTERLRAALEQSARELDAASLSRLNRARQAALAAAHPARARWLQPLRWGSALAACAVLGLALLPTLKPQPVQPIDAAAPAEFALLTDEVEPALLEDLAFYAWLDANAEDAAAWEG